MKTKLIDALLASSAGPEIRRILQLQAEAVYTELLYVRLHRVAEQNSSCEVRACITKLRGGEFAQDAVQVVFRCLEVTALDWHSSFCNADERARVESSAAEIEIDTEDSFRIVCGRVEVSSVQLEKLGERLEKKNVEPGAAGNSRHASL